jgi:hypothetical protein
VQPVPHEAAWALAATAVGFGVVQTARLRWRSGWAARQLRRRAIRARAGEAHAQVLLRRAGFRVVDEQPVAEWQVAVDGAPRSVRVRADLLVERDGRRFVAEVKTGEAAPSSGGRETRRQLLEYACAFAVDGVLLVDAEEGRIEEVAFALPSRPSPPRRRPVVIAFLVGALAGAVATVAIARSHEASRTPLPVEKLARPR